MLLEKQIPLVESFKNGLSEVIPMDLSIIFNPAEFEILFTGQHHITIPLLKSITKYESGLSANENRIKLLWECLESFNESELKKYLMFVTSCCKIPIYNRSFYIKICPLSNTVVNADNLLPVSHTCFYTLNLPNYSCLEVMKQKLLLAINQCETLDLDFLHH